MARTLSTSIPNPDDATNGVADTRIAITLIRDAAGQPVRFRVDYPQDPDGAFEANLSTLPAGARASARDFALAALAAFKAARGYV